MTDSSSLAKRSLRRKWVRRLLWAASVVLVGLLIQLMRSRPLPVELMTIEQGSFIDRLRSEGVFHARRYERITAPVDGDIKKINLRVGEPVQKGEVVTSVLWDLKWVAIRAPLTGVIAKVFRENSGPVLRGEPLLEVIDPTSLEVLVDLLTTDAARVKLGAPAKVSGWSGGSELVLEARVERVSQAGQVKVTALGVEEERTEVVLGLAAGASGSLSSLGDRFHADVEIELDRVTDQLLLPTGALIREGAGWATFRIEKGRARLVPIQIGLRSDDFAIVRKGLRRGDQVILYPGDEVQDGARVERYKAS